MARRGFHLSREYAVDPLEILFVREVMRTHIAALPAQLTGRELAPSLRADHLKNKAQNLYPGSGCRAAVMGVITRGDLKRFARIAGSRWGSSSSGARAAGSGVAYQDEPLRAVVHRMAESGLTRFPVLNNATERKLAGMVSLADLLQARTRSLEAERHRERVLHIRLPRVPLVSPKFQ